ncbi:hypothetical protein KEM56_003588 [Ascosphaera pollenicola]|nr:hypothetical protein KEM56_003588 [Ascosphaera pollenicola]
MEQPSDPVVTDGSNENGLAGVVIDSQQPSQQRQGEGESPNESMKEDNEGKSQPQGPAHEQKTVAAESTVAQENALAAQTEESLKYIGDNGAHEVEAQSHLGEQGPAVDQHHSSASKDDSIKNAENTDKESNSGEDAEAVKDNKDGIEQPQATSSQPVPEADPGKGTEEHVNPSSLHATSPSPVPARETPGDEHRDIGEGTTTQHHGIDEERAVDAGAQESDEVITDNAESNNPSNQLPTEPSNDGPPIVESTLSSKGEKQEDKASTTSSSEMAQQNGKQEMANHANHRGDPAKTHQLSAGNAPSSVPHNNRLSLQQDQRLRTDGPRNPMEGEPRRAHFNHFPEHPDKSRQPNGPRPGGEMPYKDIMDSRYRKPVEPPQFRHEPGKSPSAGDLEMPKRKQPRGTVPFGTMNSDGHEEPYDSDRRRSRIENHEGKKAQTNLVAAKDVSQGRKEKQKLSEGQSKWTTGGLRDTLEQTFTRKIPMELVEQAKRE